LIAILVLFALDPIATVRSMNRLATYLLAFGFVAGCCAGVLAQDSAVDRQIFRLPELTDDVGAVPLDGPAVPAVANPESVAKPDGQPTKKQADDAASAEDASSKATSTVVPSIADTSYWYELWDPWEGNVELGMNGTAGNTETFNVRFGANAKYKSATRNHTLQLVYLEKTANEVQTAETALADGRIEWPWDGSPWNYFIHGLTEYDQFKAFDVRVSADTGLGYEFIQNDQTTLIGRGGIAASREIGGPDDQIQPELLFGVEYKHKFSDKHSISFKSDYYPAIEDFNDFRLNSQASWEMAVAPEWGLSLKFSVIDRYDSTPHGAKPNDLDYSTLLIWAF